MLSTSLKYQWDWGNPSLIPTQINLEAYKELLNIGQSEKDLPESIQNLINETPDITDAQRKAIIAKYRDTSGVFPFFRYFRNSLALAAIIVEPEFTKENLTAEIDGTNPKRINTEFPVKLSGNVEINSTDIFFGFFLNWI